MDVQTIHVIRVKTHGRARALDRSKVKGLADSITEIGLLNPITVRETGDEYILVAGRHRLEAVKILEWPTIPAVVMDLDGIDRELAEIDENLIRNDLSVLERGEHLKSRKHWYETKHPETANGGDRGNQHTGGKKRQNAITAFSQDTAEKTGRSRRSVEVATQIAKKIPDDVRDAIRETPLANSQTDLIALSQLPEAAQREVVTTVDLTNQSAFREAMAPRQPAREPEPAPEPEPEVAEPNTMTIEVSVFGILNAIAYLDLSERMELIERIQEMNS